MIIGRAATSSVQFFSGLVDEVRVSSGVLYTGNFTPSAHLGTVTGVKGLWKFEGQTANDSSGNSNNGTLQGGAAYSTDVPTGAGGGSALNWLVTDQLGTPRMIFDRTGALASTKRHDYLPFGEELYAGTGARTSGLGYTADNVRQKFTNYERDNETGLDYAQARYHASIIGRFTSPDQPFLDQYASSPQSWNLYSYVQNNPLKFIDPSGQWHTNDKGQPVGDHDGECTDDGKFCWNEKTQAWDKGADKTPITVKPVFMDKGMFFRTLWLESWKGKTIHDWVAYKCEQQPGGCHTLAGTLVVFGPITNLSRLLQAAPEVELLGTARMNLLNAAKDPSLRNLIKDLYREGAKIGNGSTADAIRFERQTGQLLSPMGHTQKGTEYLRALEGLIRGGKLGPGDRSIAIEIMADLKSALK